MAAYLTSFSFTTSADTYAAAQLEKAKAIEPVLKAFEVLPTDVTRKPGPLSGIPVAIKDIIATSDMVTTNGSAVYKDHVPAADAWVVERLRNLGATIFGKTVSTEFAWRHPGPTTNPWNAKHTPGGYLDTLRYDLETLKMASAFVAGAAAILK